MKNVQLSEERHELYFSFGLVLFVALTSFCTWAGFQVERLGHFLIMMGSAVVMGVPAFIFWVQLSDAPRVKRWLEATDELPQ